jgi:hypothetical protein
LTLLSESSRLAVTTRYGLWQEADRLSRLKRVAFGGAAEALERVKSGFTYAPKVNELTSESADYWRTCPDINHFVAEDDLSQILAIARDVGQQRLLDQVGGSQKSVRSLARCKLTPKVAERIWLPHWDRGRGLSLSRFRVE